MTWVLIGVLAVGTLAFKVAGPMSLTGEDLPPAATRVIALIAPALLTALVVSSTFVDGERLVLDARAAGLGVGILALLVRVPMPFALVAAAAVTAVLRARGRPEPDAPGLATMPHVLREGRAHRYRDLHARRATEPREVRCAGS